VVNCKKLLPYGQVVFVYPQKLVAMFEKIILFKDARDYQILFLSLFLFLGINNRDWTLRFDLLLMVFLSCILTQTLLSSYGKFFPQKGSSLINLNFPEENRGYKFSLPSGMVHYLDISSWRSALITSLGLCLLLRANEPLTMALAGILAISSKFLFKVNNKHFFNPANLGIIAAITMTNDAWISPGQWGNDWWYLLLFIATGLMILQKVGRWDTTGVFLLTYSAMLAIYNYWLGWNVDVLQHQLMSGSLLVFSFFMLTDPRSIPNARISRIIWASMIAILAFILQSQFYVNNGVFWSLFMISPLTIFLDNIWQKKRFQWISSQV
jgi:Na+-transporting NADH:ubiquinone oxidoreductase subunit NqrB